MKHQDPVPEIMDAQQVERREREKVHGWIVEMELERAVNSRSIVGLRKTELFEERLDRKQVRIL
jgi:hypothetical protein